MNLYRKNDHQHANRRQAIRLGSVAVFPLTGFGMDSARAEPLQARIKRVIFLFMNGGPSQIDTFDPKPQLGRYDGSSYTGEYQIATGNRAAGRLWKSDFQFSRHGESGMEISELFPQVAEFADDLCVIRAMQSQSSLHAPAILEMNTGRLRAGGAGLGSWIDYGLHKSEDSLPTCVVMPDHRGAPINAHANWSAGRLPVAAPTLIRSADQAMEKRKQSPNRSRESERRMQSLLRNLNAQYRSTTESQAAMQSRERAYEQAWKMQHSAPDALDLSQETQALQRTYGLDRKQTRPFGSRCLLARRLLQRGVRFVQLYSGGGEQKDTWDSHTGNNKRHRKFAAETDQPIAALLRDLRQTGLWDETLVVWGGEFGRTPTREDSSSGRDHNPHGFYNVAGRWCRERRTGDWCH